MKSLILFFVWVMGSTCGFSQMEIKHVVRANSGPINLVAFSPDAKRFAITSGRTVEIYMRQAESYTAAFKTPFTTIDFLEFNSPQTVLISGTNILGSKKREWIEYSLKTKGISWKKEWNGKEKNFQVFKYLNKPNCIGVVAGKKVILYDEIDSTVIDFDNYIDLVKFNSNTRMLWVYDDQKIMIAYKVDLQRVFHQHEVKPKVKELAISIDGDQLVFADKRNRLHHTRDFATFRTIRLNKRRGKKQYRNLRFSWDGQYLTTSSLFHYQVWALDELTMLHERKVPDVGPIHTGFDASGKYFTTAGTESNSLFMWDAAPLNIKPYVQLKDDSDQTPPQLMVTNPKVVHNKVSVTQEEISLEGLVIDNAGILDVQVNGVKAGISSTGDFKVNMKLGIGENPVTITATDVNHNTSMKKFVINRQSFDINALNLKSENHLMVISIDDYQSWPTLNNAVSDGEAFANVLMTKYGFDSTNIIRINNGEANRQGIIDGFKELISNVGPSDNVIIYFSGHGYFDATLSEGYWIPVDAQKGQDADYLPNSFMMQLLKKVNSKHLLLVADACFSGSLFNETSRGYLDNVGSMKSRWGLASGRLEFVSDGAAGEQSPFNKHIVNYLMNNPKEEFAVSELVQYVKINVAEETNQAPVGNPLGGLGDEGGELVFKKIK